MKQLQPLRPAWAQIPASPSHARGRRGTRLRGTVVLWLGLAWAGPLVAQGPAFLQANPLNPAVVDALPMTLGPDQRQVLLTTGTCTAFYGDQPRVDLCPQAAAGADMLGVLRASRPNVGVEVLVVGTFPARLAGRADRDLVLYNLLHRFQSMVGIPYFSATHGQVRTLFTTSYRVQSPADRAPMLEPWLPVIQPIHEFFIEQTDTTFGKNLYSVSVRTRKAGVLELTMTNVEDVWFGIIPVLKPQGLRLTLLVQPSADGRNYYFYGNVGLTVHKVFGLEDKVRASFHNRILALYHWFAIQADGV